MKLAVESYNAKHDCHICRDEAGQEHRVDFMVDGGIGTTDRESLVGKVVMCAYLHPYVELAMDPRVEE